MIDFPCHHCQFRFSVPSDLAGGTIQCPTCGRLADVPTAGDLDSILPDGTYVLDKPAPPASNRLARAAHAFSRQTVDHTGHEKDLRTTMDEVLRAGSPPADETVTPAAVAPKYDPETGELIRPLTLVTREEDALDIPFAKPAVNYAMPDLEPVIGPGKVFLELFAPVNAFVMGFIFLFHVLAQVTIMTLSILFPVIGLVVLAMAIIAHYGCVVEDIGYQEIDELPRPLRGLSFIDDFILPFLNVFCALVICYGPAIVAFVRLDGEAPRDLFAQWSLVALGTILLPAVALTTITSGTIANLRPDRVLGVILRAGWPYVWLVAGWVMAFGIYVSGVWAFNRAGSGALFSGMSVSKRFWACATLLLMAGIYLMHAWCWQLALVYRAKHGTFPWVLQRHEKKKAPARPRRTKVRR